MSERAPWDRGTGELRGRRIIVVHPWPHLETVPSLCHVIESLAEAGAHVTVLTRFSDDFPRPRFSHLAVEVRTTVVDFLRKPVAYRRLRLDRAALIAAGRVLAAGVAPVIRSRLLDPPPDALIAVDPEGLLHQQRLLGKPRAARVYYSLELLLDAEIRSRRERRLKHFERRAARHCSLVVVQDPERGRLLAQSLGLSGDELVFIPNGPLGPSQVDDPRRWHERLGLPEGARVLLHAGSVYDWTGVLETVESSDEWPDDWVFVVHSRGSGDVEYFDAVQRAAASRPRVYLSRDPFPRAEFSDWVASANAVLAFYFPVPGTRFTQENLRTLGLSSGKASYALRHGVPVITNRQTSLGQLITTAGAGVTVSSPSEVGSALETIDTASGEMAAAARDLFDTHFDPRPGTKELIGRLADAIRKRGPGARGGSR